MKPTRVAATAAHAATACFKWQVLEKVFWLHLHGPLVHHLWKEVQYADI